MEYPQVSGYSDGQGWTVCKTVGLADRWFEPNTCHHLRKRPVSWGFPVSRAFLLLYRCVSSCSAVSRCVAVVTDIWRTESGRSQRFTEPLAPGFRWPPVLGEEPARLPDDHWWAEGPGPTHGPRDFTSSRDNLADTGATLRTNRAGQQPATAGLRMGGRMQRPATDKPASSWPVPRQFRRPLTDLGCTCRGPTMCLAGWYR